MVTVGAISLVCAGYRPWSWRLPCRLRMPLPGHGSGFTQALQKGRRPQIALEVKDDIARQQRFNFLAHSGRNRS